jgi:hypothetical protein
MEREVGSTMLRRTQILRVSWLSIQATSHLTLAIESKEMARKHLPALERVTSALSRENTPMAQAATRHFKASSDYLKAPGEAPIRGLKEASELYRATGFEIHAASIDMLVGRLIGGEEGENLKSHALGTFHRADVDTQGNAARAYAPDLGQRFRKG